MVSLSGWLACLDGLHEDSLSVLNFGELLAGSSVFCFWSFFFTAGRTEGDYAFLFRQFNMNF